MELIGFVIALAIIVFMTQRGYKLYWAIFSGIVVVIVSNRFTPDQVVSIILQSLSSQTMITLTLIVITLTAFGNLLKEIGSLKRIMQSLAILIRDLRYQVVILPLLIGFITFPGGAVFSAPLVEEAGNNLGLNKNRMVVANIAFRHIQYLIYPLYPGLILIAEISRYNLYDYIIFNLPIFIVFFYIIFKIVFRGVKTDKQVGAIPTKEAVFKELFELAYSLCPLIVIILLVVIFQLYFPLAIIIGILAAFFSYLPNHPSLWETANLRLKHLLKGINWSMVLAIISILIFKDILDHSEVVDDIMLHLIDNRLPMLALVIIIPFLSGFIMGNPYASLGISVPLFLPILPDSPQGFYYMTLVFVCALAGYLGSPIHTCTILTTEYFKASLFAVLKEVNIIGAVLMLLGLLSYLVWQYII